MHLRAALKTVSDITGENIRVSRIPHALTNRVYRVKGREQSWSLRISHENPGELGVLRGREEAVLDSIKLCSWAPNIDYFDSKLCLTQWVNGPHLILNSDQKILKLASLIEKIHQMPTTEIAKQEPIHIDEQINLLINNLEYRLTASFNEALQQKIHQYAKPSEQTLCHFDLHSGNLIETEVGLKVLDWEYAALGDPTIDIACAIEGFKLNEAETDTLINHFNLTSEQLELPICLVQALSLLWYMNRQAIVNFESEQLAWIERWQ